MVRNSFTVKILFPFACAATLLLTTACTQKTGTATVQITIPKFTGTLSTAVASSSSVSAMGTNATSTYTDPTWGLADPPVGPVSSAINCYGVFVGGSDSGLDAGTVNDQSGNLMFKFGVVGGLVGSQGGTLSVQVPAGPSRNIVVFGMALASGYSCEHIDMVNHSLTKQIYSNPIILGGKVVDLSPGTAPIQIDAYYTSSSSKIGTIIYPTNNGGANAIYLGSGVDGDLSISTPTDLSTTAVAGHYLSASTGITDIIASASYPSTAHLTASNSLTSTFNYFAVNDEVMLYVAAEHSTTGTSGCQNAQGIGLAAGMRVPGKVVTWTSSTVDVTFNDQRVFGIPQVNVQTSSRSSTGDFCQLTIVRVPQLNSLILNSGASITSASFGGVISPSSGGGILAMRVKNGIVVHGNATIAMDGAGYHGGSMTSPNGENPVGQNSTPSTATASGGGGGSMGGAGGANGGNGGSVPTGGPTVPAGFSSSLDDASACSGIYNVTVCLLGKLFMGGGGGVSGSSFAGGNGGGIIAIFAKSLQIDAGATLSIKSNGLAGTSATPGAGGGAGGSILIRLLDLQASGTLGLSAVGGMGGTGSTNGGGGGGGRVHVDIINSCSVPSTTPTMSAGGGGSGASSISPTYTGPAVSSSTCHLN